MSDCGTNPQILSVYLDLQGAGFWFSVSGGNQDESQSPTPFFPWKPVPPLRSLFLSLLSLTRLETLGSHVYLPLPWSQVVKSWRFCFFYSFHIWVSFPFPMQSPKRFLFRLLFTFWLPFSLIPLVPLLCIHYIWGDHISLTLTHGEFSICSFSSHALRIGHTGLSNFLNIPRHPGEAIPLLYIFAQIISLALNAPFSTLTVEIILILYTYWMLSPSCNCLDSPVQIGLLSLKFSSLWPFSEIPQTLFTSFILLTKVCLNNGYWRAYSFPMIL